ncbi:MAG: hypothetical protein U0935_21175 [Pirellulales bacterium]
MIHHLLSHSDTADWLKVNQFFVEQLAYIARKLNAIQEGERTALDNSMLMLRRYFWLARGTGRGCSAPAEDYQRLAELHQEVRGILASLPRVPLGGPPGSGHRSGRVHDAGRSAATAGALAACRRND